MHAHTHHVYTHTHTHTHTHTQEGRRPLIPKLIPLSPEAAEVVETCRTAAELGRRSLSAYVISMATAASDVLAVELLQREARNLVWCSTEWWY